MVGSDCYLQEQYKLSVRIAVNRQKFLGRVDMCMYCNEPLTLDPTLEGKEFDQSYNSKRQ